MLCINFLDFKGSDRSLSESFFVVENLKKTIYL